MQRRSSMIFKEPSFLSVGNLYQSSTTIGLDPVSSDPPKTNWLYNAMEISLSFTPKVATKTPKIFEESLLQLCYRTMCVRCKTWIILLFFILFYFFQTKKCPWHLILTILSLGQGPVIPGFRPMRQRVTGEKTSILYLGFCRLQIYCSVSFVTAAVLQLSLHNLCVAIPQLAN